MVLKQILALQQLLPRRGLLGELVSEFLLEQCTREWVVGSAPQRISPGTPDQVNFWGRFFVLTAPNMIPGPNFFPRKTRLAILHNL